ncbi:MAG: 16S rRNA (cytosine(1402)-N(4))-methyltransferase RsmH [Chloroflexi bacterium]|nr:16S rRNA (cytosine(1402)-N(4))-methyltransferase RsmH [Chloroflexota bacterium]
MIPELPPSAHIPVLREETIHALAVQAGGRYIDCTLGAGGHAIAILERSAPGGQLLGIDADPTAIELARQRLASFGKSSLLLNENFADLEATCIKHDFFPVHGILFDLGLASFQVDREERGFSFQKDGPLDMRVNPAQKTSAADIVNTYPESELANIIWTYGEETHSRRIARYIVQERPIRNTLQLTRIIEKAVGGRREKIHPATRTFQALRIAVNRELENLESALKQAVSLLGFEGRLVVISYHSLEDRIVKQFMQRESRDCICAPQAPICVCGHVATLRMVSRRAIKPSPEEIDFNPRSRSARLRVAGRIVNQDTYYKAVEDEGFSNENDAGGWRRPALLRKIRMAFAASCN